MRIVVTGGNGLVGSALKKLADRDREWLFPDFDLRKFGDVIKFFKETNPTHVIHLASVVGGIHFNSLNNLEIFRTNYQINDNVLKAAAHTSVEKVISCLSTCVFANVPASEKDIHCGRVHDSNQGYAYAKRVLDMLNSCYASSYPNTTFTSVIPCNIFGPNDNFSIERGHVIPSTMHKLYKGAETLHIFGTGKPTRQFIFSEDLARLLVHLVDTYEDPEPMIVAPSEEHSIEDTIRAICNIAQSTPTFEYDLSKPDGPPRRTVDNSKLQKYLRETLAAFEFTPFEEALRITYEWFQTNHSNARTESKYFVTPKNRHILVKMLCNWCTSRELMALWDKMGHGNYSYHRNGATVTMTDDSRHDNEVDLIVVVNGSEHKPTVQNLRKTIFMKMEPVLFDPFWGYVHDNPELLMDRFTHLPGSYNNNEWHVSRTLSELSGGLIEKKYDKEISAILSCKESDPGQITRLRFARIAQHRLPWHSYGADLGWVNYRGVLPPYCKDAGLVPYKYTFNVENTKLPGYYTEKLIDAILCETLCFYSGHEDIVEHVDPRAYVLLDFEDIEGAIRTMRKSIDSNLWEERLPHIKAAKQKILESTSFFPRVLDAYLKS